MGNYHNISELKEKLEWRREWKSQIEAEFWIWHMKEVNKVYEISRSKENIEEYSNLKLSFWINTLNNNILKQICN